MDMLKTVREIGFFETGNCKRQPEIKVTQNTFKLFYQI
jgi:hypothetical protein